VRVREQPLALEAGVREPLGLLSFSRTFLTRRIVGVDDGGAAAVSFRFGSYDVLAAAAAAAGRDAAE
jgi:hypothetical protein